MRRRPLPLVCLTALSVVAGACTYQSRAVLPEVPQERQSSTLYAADGTLVNTFHAEENRKVVPLEEIPAHVRDAVIAIEDERFYRHRGVDVRAVLRALRANTRAGQVAEGGSTITQQYVKKVILQDDSQTVSRKVEEASMALQLERQYSKERILELYLNAIYFGNGAYGIEAAARQYFGKSVPELTLAEGALLAGLIQRPSATDPYKAPDEALARRNVVLERMRRNRFASDAEVDAALAEPLALGSAVTPAAERYAAPYFVEEVKQWILDDPRFGATPRARRDLLFGGGLRIHTTVDLALQSQAEQAAQAILPDPGGPAVSLVSIEPATGYVRAMVGGRDFFGTGPNDKLNLATQGGRSAGSSFKPFILATALEEGIDPETQLPAPGCINIPLPNEIWDVCNAEGTGPAVTSIIEGTVHSYNTLYAQLILRVGPERAMATATRLGIRSPLQTNPASVLGTNNVTAMDMASAYASFANRGVHVPPVLVTRITRADGTLLYEHEHTQEKVLDAGVADTVSSILEQVIQRGTGTRAKLDRPAAGKTGSSQKNRDAWFVGYTPDLATAVWVGFPDVGANGQLVSMRPPNTKITVFGGTYPAQIWQRFMTAALAGRPPSAFHPPTSTTTTSPPGLAPTTTATAPRPPVAVPTVVGEKVADAVAALQAAGFTVERIPAADGSGPPGRVVAQSPVGGRTAPAGSTVRIEVTPEPSG
jgi:penicillin-binding protein 1A